MSDETGPQGARGAEAPPPDSSSRTKLIVGGAVIVAIALALILSSGGEPAPDVSGTRTIQGEITFSGDSDSVFVSSAGGTRQCSGLGEYNLIVQGAGVSIKDSEGNEIGAGQLVRGAVTGRADSYTCSHTFTARNLPETDLYVVAFTSGDEFARFTAEELEEMDWQISVDL